MTNWRVVRQSGSRVGCKGKENKKKRESAPLPPPLPRKNKQNGRWCKSEWEIGLLLTPPPPILLDRVETNITHILLLFAFSFPLFSHFPICTFPDFFFFGTLTHHHLMLLILSFSLLPSHYHNHCRWHDFYRSLARSLIHTQRKLFFSFTLVFAYG